MIYFTFSDSFPAWTGWVVGSVDSFVGFSIAPYGAVRRKKHATRKGIRIVEA